MKSKIADVLCSFCISCGGLALAFLYRVDALSIFFVLTLSVAFSLFCCSLGNRTISKEWVKKFFALGAFVSAAVSTYIGTRLVCGFCLDNSFVPICVFLSCVVSLCIALSTLRASKSVVAVICAMCLLLLFIVLILCLFESNFSKVVSNISDIRLVFPLSVFGAIDTLFIMPYIKQSNRCTFVIGSALMPAYVLLTVIFTISTLSSSVYNSFDTPIITMWQSCYVASFIDRFETVVLCTLFAVCSLKSGLFLKCVFDNFSKTNRPIIFIAFLLLPITLLLKPALIYFYAAICFGCVVLCCFNLVLKKSY